MDNKQFIRVIESTSEHLHVLWGEVEVLLSIDTGTLEGAVMCPPSLKLAVVPPTDTLNVMLFGVKPEDSTSGK